MIMGPRNILDLNIQEKRQFLDSFDHVFSDLDGVVWNISNDIKGAGEGIKELRRAGKNVTFITNNSVRSEQHCMQKLHLNNIDVESHDIIHPAKSIAEYLSSINFEGLIYILASQQFKNVLREAGFELLEGPDVILNESFTELISLARDHQPVKAVIIDYDFNLSLLKFMKADFYLHQPDCLLIAGATDFQLPLSKDLTILGPGLFIKILQQISRKEMLIFGKPGQALMKLLMHRSHVSAPDRALMIGDMLEQDVRFANSCGFQSLLVLSGGCSYDKLMAQTDPNIIPKYYANSLADFVEFMADMNKSKV